MSKGLGRVQRAIQELGETLAFRELSVQQLCVAAYGLPQDQIAKRHRVAVLRAMHRLRQTNPAWTTLPRSRFRFAPPPQDINQPIWAWRGSARGVVWERATIVRSSARRRVIEVDGQRVTTDSELRPIGKDRKDRDPLLGYHFEYERNPWVEKRVKRFWRIFWAAFGDGRDAASDSDIAIALFDLSAGYTKAAVLHQFRKRSLRLHPDQGGDNAAFRALVKARDLLLAAFPE